MKVSIVLHAGAVGTTRALQRVSRLPFVLQSLVGETWSENNGQPQRVILTVLLVADMVEGATGTTITQKIRPATWIQYPGNAHYSSL